MKKFFLAVLCTAVACQCYAQPSAPETENASSQESIQIPLIQRDDYFGSIVDDPYSLFEYTEAPVTLSWVNAQNSRSEQYFKNIEFFPAIETRMGQLADFVRFAKVKTENDGYTYFLRYNGTKQNQPVLFRQKGLLGQPEMVLDANTFSADGTTTLGEYAFSNNGKYMAFAKQASGSDKQTAHVLELGTGRLLPDTLSGLIFSNLAWHGDGFYYQKFPQVGLFDANEYAKVYFHTLGTPQSSDALIFEDKNNARMMFGIKTLEKEGWLVLTGAQTTSKNSVFVQDLTQKNSPFITVVADDKTADYEIIGIEAHTMFVLTNDVPNGRLVEIDLLKPEPNHWKTILPERENSVLQGCWFAGKRLVAHYLVDCYSTLQVFEKTGKALGEIELPEKIGQVTEFNGSQDSPEAFFGFCTFTRPTSIYRLDMNTLTPSSFKLVAPPMDVSQLVSIQKWCVSKDGTKIPMTIVMKKGTVLNGRNPCLQYGYGGFQSPVLPRFGFFSAAFLEAGGIYVSVNCRGGNEFGEKWHQAGTLSQKQNVFDDFIAASEWLIANGYTSKDLLAINGASNGGLLVGACLTQRPDLYKVCLPQVAVLDMLRYDQASIGKHWQADYGTSSTKEGFDYLFQYSPLHNVKPTQYPATFVLTGKQDDRVAPWHSFKFAATLQEKQQGSNPILLYATDGAGHGAGKSVTKQIHEASKMLAFTFKNMGLTYKAP